LFNLRDLIFSRRWRFRSSSSGLWRWRQRGLPETLVSYITTRRHKPRRPRFEFVTLFG